MKTIQWILFTTVCIYAEEIKPKSDNPSIASQPNFVFDKDKLLEDFNKRRREFAKKKHFAKMFKLEWDEKLAKEASDKETSCKDCRSYYDMPKNVYALHYMEILYEGWLKNDTGLKGYPMENVGYHEVLVSGQKKVGCSTGDYSLEFSSTISDKKYGMKCLLTPENDFKTYDVDIGEAGSQCEFFSYVNDDGLCAKSFRNLFIVIGCVVAALLILVVVVIAVVVFILRRKKKKAQGSKTTGAATATGTTPTGTTNTGTVVPASGRY